MVLTGLKHAAITFALVSGLFTSSCCKQETEEKPLTWQEKYTGNYTFTTIYHDGMHFVDDTTIYNGTSAIQDENTHLLKIDYAPGLTLHPHVSDSGELAIENIGSHDSFSGHFNVNGDSIHFYRTSYYESWDVTGVKQP